MIDLRTDAELARFASLVRAVDLATSGAPWLIAGAMARDLLLSRAHGIRIGRLARDDDIAIAVESWEAFDTIRAALIGTGRFAPLGVGHKVQYENGVSLDLIPFGALESSNRASEWHPIDPSS